MEFREVLLTLRLEDWEIFRRGYLANRISKQQVIEFAVQASLEKGERVDASLIELAGGELLDADEFQAALTAAALSESRLAVEAANRCEVFAVLAQLLASDSDYHSVMRNFDVAYADLGYPLLLRPGDNYSPRELEDLAVQAEYEGLGPVEIQKRIARNLAAEFDRVAEYQEFERMHVVVEQLWND